MHGGVATTGELTVLLSMARDGDRAALEDLLARMHHAISLHLKRRLCGMPGGSILADDAAQTALVKIIQHLDSCRAQEDGQLMAWALRIARNAAMDELRDGWRRYASHSIVEEIAMATDHDAVPSEPLQTLSRMLADILDELPERHQRLVWLRYGEERTWEEVGRELGTTRYGAKRQWQRLNGRLRSRILAAVKDLPGPLRGHVREWIRGERR